MMQLMMLATDLQAVQPYLKLAADRFAFVLCCAVHSFISTSQKRTSSGELSFCCLLAMPHAVVTCFLGITGCHVINVTTSAMQVTL